MVSWFGEPCVSDAAHPCCTYIIYVQIYMHVRVWGHLFKVVIIPALNFQLVKQTACFLLFACFSLFVHLKISIALTRCPCLFLWPLYTCGEDRWMLSSSSSCTHNHPTWHALLLSNTVHRQSQCTSHLSHQRIHTHTYIRTHAYR